VKSRLAGAVAAAVFLSACGAASSPDRTPTPVPAPAAGPRAVLPSGAVYGLELALTPEEQAQGLMYRESLPEKTGMLFLFPDSAPHGFWMKNTMIPLDMVWMDASGRVVYVSADTPPCKADPCPTYGPEGPARMVLEIAGGMAAREKITVGSTLRFEDLPK
jgi:uncharacterized membrane protein (UPF0127 family)